MCCSKGLALLDYEFWPHKDLIGLGSVQSYFIDRKLDFVFFLFDKITTSAQRLSVWTVVNPAVV